MHERVPFNELAQRIVLVGTTALGLNDLRTAPMNNQYPGVEANANIIASILDGSFKQTPDYSDAVNFIQVIVVGSLLIIGLPLLGPLLSIVYALTIGVAVTWLNFWAYRVEGLVLPVAVALVLILALFIFNVAWGYWFEFRKGRAITNLFGEYVAPELVEEMAEDPQHYTMEGDKRELTTLFVDVRDFTSISEGLEPNELREFINIYLTAMSTIIRDSRGTLEIAS